MIRQCTAARANASIATGIDLAIRRICAEHDFCAAPFDAVLAEIAHIVVVQDDSSRTMSPACLPRSSAQVMMPLSPTTTTPSSPPSHTHPTSYLGAVLSPKEGDCKPLSHSLQATMAQESAAIMLHRMARPRKRPCPRHGCRNVPPASNHSDKAIPSHPQPMMGGTSTLTTTLPATSARATNHRSMRSLPMSFAMTLSSSPSLQPFMLNEQGTIKMGERDAHQRKGMCCRIRPHCVG